MMEAIEVLQWAVDVWSSLTGTALLLQTSESVLQGRVGLSPLRLVPRSSIFSEISLEHAPPKSLNELRVDPKDPVVPFPRSAGKDFETWLDAYLPRVTSELQILKGTPEEILQAMIAIWEFYLEGVGVSEQAQAQSTTPFPLYMQLQIAVKLAEREQQVQLVYGDLSGIQKYIFDVSRLGVTGLAKKLRARSFRIAMMARIFAYEFCAQNKMTPLQVCMSAGGVFYLVLPPNAGVEPIVQRMNEWLYEKYHCQITLQAVGQTFSVQSLTESFSEAAAKVVEKARAAKDQAFSSLLQSQQQWNETAFVFRQEPLGQRCEHCQRHPIHRAGLCQICDLDEQIGRQLPKMQWLRIRHDVQGTLQFLDKWSIELWETRPQPGYVVFSINRQTGTPQDPVLWMNHHVPVAPSDCPHCLALPHPETRVRRGEVYTFSCLSALGPNGEEPLGYLKADVDQMGFLFSLGFVNEDQESATMAQYFTLSQSLDRFFAYYLGQLMVKTYPHLYSVFAGGDDVYVIGRARDILHFAKEMASTFQTYVGDHPDVTLSAGVAFVKPRSPLSRVTAQVEEFLELAKEQPSWERGMHHLSGRNQVTFHGLPYSWPALDQLLEDTERVLSFVQAKILSMGGMHRLLAWVSQCPRSPSITGLIDWQQGESYRLLPHVAYMLERTWTQEQRRNVAQIRAVHEWISRYFTFVDETDAIRISRFEALMYLLGLFKGKEHEVS